MANENNMTLATADTTTIATWLEDKNVTQQIAGALAGYVDPATFRAQCALAVNDPNLFKCSLPSLLAGFLKCAQMGLLPGKHHGHVALIPREGKDGNFAVDVMPQWQGFKFIMERQPGIKRVTPVLVHESDVFSVDDGVVRHSFDPFDADRQFLHPSDAKDGKTGLRGAYLKIEHDDGEVRYHFMGAAAIEKRRMCSQTPDMDKWGKAGIWRKWYPEQCLKTVARDAWSRRAVSIDPTIAGHLGLAESEDDAAMGNDPARVAVTTNILTADKVEVAEWADNDRKAFMAELTRLGMKYEDVKAWLLEHRKPAPRDMTEQKRRDLLTALANGIGAKFRAWRDAKAPQTPATTLDAELTDSTPENAAEGQHGPSADVLAGRVPAVCEKCAKPYTYSSTNSDKCAECCLA